MSVSQDITLIGVTGTRESIVRMMNAAICNAGTGNVICDGDSLETMNRKIMDAEGRYGIMICIPDLLDKRCMQDAQLREKKQTHDNLMNASTSCTNDCEAEDCPWNSNPEDCPKNSGYTGSSRAIETVRIEAKDEVYTAKFSLYEYECYFYSDWLYWDEIARLYNCRIFVDDRLYSNGCLVKFCSAIIFEPADGTVKETVIRPDEDGDKCDYDAFYGRLAALYPERYQPLLDEYLDGKRRRHGER